MIRTERRGPVALITLDRPEKRNALSIELRHALADALARAAGDDEVRVTTITGAGSAFCAGMDVDDFGKGEALLTATDAFVEALVRHPKPLVARVNGPAVGGGFVLALLCDIRVAAPAARFGFPEVERGIPASYGAARRVLPRGTATELCMTGRIVDAEEAVRLGIAVAEDPVERIAGLPPRGLRMLKRWTATEADELLELERQAFRDAILRGG